MLGGGQSGTCYIRKWVRKQSSNTPFLSLVSIVSNTPQQILDSSAKHFLDGFACAGPSLTSYVNFEMTLRHPFHHPVPASKILVIIFTCTYVTNVGQEKIHRYHVCCHKNSLGEDCHKKAWEIVGGYLASTLRLFCGKSIDAESTILPSLSSWIGEAFTWSEVFWWPWPGALGQLAHCGHPWCKQVWLPAY